MSVISLFIFSLKYALDSNNRQENVLERFIVRKLKKLHCFKITIILS
jgi:hypothetical protein